jgi:hypothetical protein
MELAIQLEAGPRPQTRTATFGGPQHVVPEVVDPTGRGEPFGSDAAGGGAGSGRAHQGTELQRRPVGEAIGQCRREGERC